MYVRVFLPCCYYRPSCFRQSRVMDVPTKLFRVKRFRHDRIMHGANDGEDVERCRDCPRGRDIYTDSSNTPLHITLTASPPFTIFTFAKV